METNGDWDYKNNSNLQRRFSQTKLDEFGNIHFGIVANSFRFNLEGSMYGAGAYQVAIQGGGNPKELALATYVLQTTFGGYILPNTFTRYVTNNGFTWGDNLEDARHIMNGWDYGKLVYGN